MTASRITAFEVAPAGDAAFLAAWAGAPGALLLRALRRDVAFRFVALGPEAPPPTPFAAHGGEYEAVEEHGDPAGAGGVLLVAPFAVADGEDEGFLAGWAAVHEHLTVRQGWIGARLHRALGPAEFRFVALVRWSSPLMYARALQQPEIAEAVAGLPGSPALYLPVSSQVMP